MDAWIPAEPLGAISAQKISVMWQNISVIWIFRVMPFTFDIDYMDGYRVFTWNDAKYGKPRGSDCGKSKKQGFKTVTIIDPGTKVDPDYFMCKKAKKTDICDRYTGNYLCQ